MLQNLKIKNLAVIPEADISFKSGLNILSGETGAGKSIIIEAISLILGGRSNADLIRKDCEEATVEGLFDVAEMPWIAERLQKKGMSLNGSDLLIKRIVQRSGRHRIFINGDLATQSILQEICEGLIDLCGQHEHQALLKNYKQFQLLDRYGGLEKNFSQVQELWSQRQVFLQEIESLNGNSDELQRRLDFLRFQVEELRSADLLTNEDDILSREKQSLQTVDSRSSRVKTVQELLDAEDCGALDQLRKSRHQLQALLESESATEIIDCEKQMQECLITLEEISLQLSRYADDLQADPSRLDWINERLALIASLRRKYGPSVADMLAMLEKLNAELGQLEGREDKLSQLGAQVVELEKNLREHSARLTRSRKNVAKLLSDSVTREIQDLKMDGAYLSVQVSELEEFSQWTVHGLGNALSFDVCTNPGDAAKPIQKIVSGGELSRLMLAIRRVIADKGGIGVYLFDEIDSGMGGQTAFEVGKKLKAVSQYNQVICITHLAQVASFADHHISVQKIQRDKAVLTVVLSLDKKGIKEEIARMLGGPKLTPNSLKNAAELLRLAQ